MWTTRAKRHLGDMFGSRDYLDESCTDALPGGSPLYNGILNM